MQGSPTGTGAPVRSAVALDLGGNSIRAAVALPDGRLRHALRIPTRPHRPAPEIEQDLVDLYRECSARSEGNRTSGIAGAAAGRPVGLALPGLLSSDGSSIARAANLPTLIDHPLIANLRREFNAPLTVTSDALAAAAAERNLADDSGTDRRLVVVIGTGIGAALIDNDRISPTPLLGQIEIACAPGKQRAVLEAVAAGPALDRAVRFATRQDLDHRAIGDRIGRSDPPVGDAVRQWAARLVDGLASWLERFPVPGIVIAGGITRYGPALLAGIRAAQSHHPALTGVDIRFSSLGADAVLIGAGLIALGPAESR